MSTISRVLRNVAIVSGGQAVTWCATIAFVLVQARFLGPARFGELSLALSYAAFFAIVVDFGVATHLTRRVAQGESDERAAVWSALAVRTSLWILATPTAWLLTLALGYGAELQATILILIDSLLFVGVTGALAAYYQGHERFLLPTIANVLQRVAAAVVGIVVVAAGFGILTVAAVYAFSAALGCVLLIAGLRGSGVLAPRFDAGATLALFRSVVPIGLYWVIGTFYFNVDMALVERLTPRDSLGHYAAAYRLFNALTIVPAIVCGTVLFPLYSRLSTVSLEALRPAVEKTISYLAVAGILVTVLGVTLASPIIAVLYPMPAYGPAASALRLLAPGLLFLYLNSVLASVLFATHRERRLLAIAVMAAVLNTGANLIAIPVFGQEAAAAITSATELFLLVCLFVAVPRGLLRAASAGVALRASVAGGVAALAMLPVAEAPVIVSGLVGCVAFACACFLFGVFPVEDVRALRALVRGRVDALGLVRAG